MRRRIPPFLTTKRGFVGALLTFYVVAHLALDALQDIDYLIRNAGAIAGFLTSALGNTLILGVGLFLILWAVLSGPPEAAGARVVARVEKWGPERVSDEGYAHVHCRVPYTAYGEPLTIEVEGEQDTFLINIAYQVRSVTEDLLSEPTTRVSTSLNVLDENGDRIRTQTAYMGTANVSKDRTWSYMVSCGTTLSDLEKGVYGLEVYDYTDASGGREYRDMRLVVTKLG